MRLRFTLLTSPGVRIAMFATLLIMGAFTFSALSDARGGISTADRVQSPELVPLADSFGSRYSVYLHLRQHAPGATYHLAAPELSELSVSTMFLGALSDAGPMHILSEGEQRDVMRSSPESALASEVVEGEARLGAFRIVLGSDPPTGLFVFESDDVTTFLDVALLPEGVMR